MGIYSRYSAAVLAVFLFFSSPVFSAYRTDLSNLSFVKPSNIINSSTTPAFSTPNGDIAFYGKEHTQKFDAGSRFSAGQNPSANLPAWKQGVIKIKPTLEVPKSKILSSLKKGLKVSPGAIAAQVATGAALAAVGWVMSPDNTTLQKPTYDSDNSLSLFWCGEFNSNSCHGGSASTKRYATPDLAKVALDPFFCDQYGSACVPGSVVSTVVVTGSSAVYKWSFPVAGKTYSISGSLTLYRHGSCSSGFTYISSTGVCQSPFPSAFAPLTDSDFGALDPWVSSQTAPWLSGLIKEVCNGSLSPNACYDEMKSGVKITGPASLAGPASTTTGTFTRPDGSTGTRSTTTNTNYTFNYGNTYFDTKTTTTTTNTVDGVPTSTDTIEDTTPVDESPPEDEEEPSYTFNDSDLPSVDPFYTQKYPDGFQGVWSSSKNDFDNSAFVSFLNSFVPSFSGSCPAFSLSFNISSWANYGVQNFSSLCYVLDFVKACIMLGALFLCRAIVFGG